MLIVKGGLPAEPLAEKLDICEIKLTSTEIPPLNRPRARFETEEDQDDDLPRSLYQSPGI
jgi:hypothetical protein